jgi:GT2 family glycosyltransferase
VTSTRPDLAVVIPVRNGAATLPAQLRALAEQRDPPPFEVIVSDNGSEDDLAGALRAAAEAWPALDLRCVDSGERAGVSHARNVGARAARADSVAFCDSDDTVGPEWVRAMAEGLDRYDSVGGPLDERSLNRPEARAQAHVADALPVGLGFLPYAVGANCGVRRAVWAELGGFDEDFTQGAEEVDFFWRLQRAGHTLGFAPDAVVAYRHRADLRGTVRQAFKYGGASCQLVAAHRLVVPRESLPTIARAWLRLLVRLPLLAVPDRRPHFLRRVAHKAGQVVGSWRFRVVHLA